MKFFQFCCLALILACNAPRLWAQSAAQNQAPRTLYTFDARPLRELDLAQPSNARTVWDSLQVLAALQGLANRRAPQFYLFYCREFGVDTDQFWLDWARHEDTWLAKTRLVPLPNIEAALKQFRKNYRGLVVYDERVPATSAVASTIAGCDDLLPVRYDLSPNSLYSRLRKLKIPVRVWLVNRDGSAKFTGRGQVPDIGEISSGSAKIDAYRWALRKYLQTGKCNPRFAAYYVDAFWLDRPRNGAPDMHTLSNHDYFIAQRAFFFDLAPWGDEKPIDDALQVLGADRAMLLQILRALSDGAHGEIIKIGGFPPWPFKYTTHGGAGRHEGVPTEWEFTKLISQFNAYHEADAANLGAMANASLWRHYPLQARYTQPNPRPNLANWQHKGYVLPDGSVAKKCFVAHYAGDYDAPAWLYKAVPAHFNDKNRGQVPLGWAFDPNLSDRAPQALVYAYRHATPNDFFISGDSGAGYLNARSLTIRPDSGLPSGLEKWAQHNRKYFALWDMDITGFVLDGAGGASTDTEWASYKTFSPRGFGTHYERGPTLHLGVPSIPERDLPDDVEKAAEIIAKDANGSDQKPVFQWRRSVLKSPTWFAQLSQILAEKYPQARVEVVDPYTLFGLIEYQLTHEAKP